MPVPLFLLIAAAAGGTGVAIGKGIKRQVETEADRQRAINEIDVGLGSASAQNRFDVEQLEAMQTQLVDAQAMLRSRSPKLRALGASRIQSLDAAVRGQHQDRQPASPLRQLLEKPEAVEDRHLQVEDDQVDLVPLDPAQRPALHARVLQQHHLAEHDETIPPALVRAEIARQPGATSQLRVVK